MDISNNKKKSSVIDERASLIQIYANLEAYYADMLCPIAIKLYHYLTWVMRKLPERMAVRIALLSGFVKVAINSIAIDGCSILDVGCGTERLYLYDAIPNVQVMGLDLRVGSDDRVKLCDVEKTGSIEGLVNKKFDFIILDQSLEHFCEPKKVLRRLHPMLTENGTLVVATPNTKSLPAKLFGQYWSVWEPGFHITHFNKELLIDYVNSCGYKIQKVETYNLGVFFLKSLRNIIQPQNSVVIETTITYHLLFPFLKIFWGAGLRCFGDGECVVIIARKRTQCKRD